MLARCMGARFKIRPKLLLLGFSPCHLTGDQDDNANSIPSTAKARCL